FAERLVGSIRRECLDHVIVLGETHLRRILKSYFDYYLFSRTHLSLAKDARPLASCRAGGWRDRRDPAGWWPAPSLRTARCVTDASLGPAVPYLENRNLAGARARPNQMIISDRHPRHRTSTSLRSFGRTFFQRTYHYRVVARDHS